MSNASAATQEFDFWEFVHCSRCHLQFSPDAGGPPLVPFWVTECGHVICNNHLNPDQSCALCGEQGIQVVPLQREMDAPMSDWFCSVPRAFDTIAYAARFQIETLGSLVRYYKRKCAQQRTLLERLKAEASENKQLKKVIEGLESQLDQFRQYGGYDRNEPSELMNGNGKRRMLGAHRHPNGAHTNSSPRSIATPLAPNRLTLPPSHQQPSLIPHRQHDSDNGPQPAHPPSTFNRPDRGEYSLQKDRPGSSRFAEQYSYTPARDQQSATLSSLPLSHTQAAPTRQAQARHQTAHQEHDQAHIAMPPPLSINLDGQTAREVPQAAQHQSRTFKDADMRMPPPQIRPSPSGQPQHRAQQRSSFQPSGAPRKSFAEGSFSNRPGGLMPFRSSGSINANTINHVPQTNRFVPPGTAQSGLQTHRFMPSTPSGGPQRFATPLPGAGVPPSAGGGSRAPSRATSGLKGGGQRMPFVPGAQGGFG